MHAKWVGSVFVLTLACLPSRGQTSLATNAPRGTALSTRVVAYVLDANIDVEKKSVDAKETLTYKNLTGQPLTTFPFHLYLNGFQPDSTFTTETHAGGGIRDSESESAYPAKKLGSIAITHLEADGFGDLTGRMRFVAPDDGNVNDKTVAEVTLPHALAPGDAITFHMNFHDQFPESIARNGYKRDFMMGGQWFPKVGVFWHGAWNCHQYHATTEFFADFGTFDVSLTLKKNYTVGASGVPTGERTNNDGTRTLWFYGEDIHDFAWAASPNFVVTNGTYLSSMGPVQVRVLGLKAHPGVGKRYLDIILASLAQFDQRYGPYPYKVLTVVDPEPGSEMEGMEYPTLITAGTTIVDPTRLTEITAEHEFGHQYWYGMVATNEFEDAWLDEGINSYTEVKVTGAVLGRETNVIGLRWANLSDAMAQYTQYAAMPDYDPVTRHAWQFRDASSYGGVTYGKSATLLATLEGLVGTDTMDAAMRTYFMRYRFTHPATEDFLRTIEEVAIARGRAVGKGEIPVDILKMNNLNNVWDEGTLYSTLGPGPHQMVYYDSSLRPFFKQAVYGTALLDYGIDDISSEPVRWWVSDMQQQKLLRDVVTVHRIGDFLLPVTLEVVFSDGSRVREQWDGQDRWKSFTYVREAKVVSAEIDPDHKLLLDLNRFNNSRTVAANPVPARKIANIWTSFLQLSSQLAGWLV
jgi:hypothetical protein